MRADEILVLENGQVVQRGKHEELLEEEGLYRSIYDLELRDQEEALGSSEGTQAGSAGDSPNPAEPEPAKLPEPTGGSGSGS